ncbi:hypothetical protein ATANTOWER_003835 [Ataeniobius toweri]|uniref:Uncharacterized protein n=1 Tax=Ataeniobius toweri TaxID=208326 RepID=A0ABU7B518_9TELE|nr:hypothetical protein [Ataeniobius toweri]
MLADADKSVIIHRLKSSFTNRLEVHSEMKKLLLLKQQRPRIQFENALRNTIPTVKYSGGCIMWCGSFTSVMEKTLCGNVEVTSQDFNLEMNFGAIRSSRWTLTQTTSFVT